MTENKSKQWEMIPCDAVVTGKHETRADMDQAGIVELAESIRDDGLINPVTVSRQGGVYVLVIGHRRYAAHRYLGEKEIKAYVSDEDPTVLERQIRAENIHRADLTPIEIADDLYHLIIEDETPVDKVARIYHKSEAWVRSHLAITTWPECLIDAVHRGLLKKAAAEELARVTDIDTLEFFLRQATESGITARVARAWADGWLSQLPPAEAVQQEPEAAPCNVQPMKMVMPCLVCKNEYSPDELVHAYVCVHCHGRIQKLPDDNYI